MRPDQTATELRAAHARALVYVHVLAYPGLTRHQIALQARLPYHAVERAVATLMSEQLAAISYAGTTTGGGYRVYAVPPPDPEARAKTDALHTGASRADIMEASLG